MERSGRTLKEVRLALGISLELAAVVCKMSVSGITRWESGEGGTYLRSRERLHEYCGYLHNEARRMARHDVKTRPWDLCPDIFHAPTLEVAA